MLGIVMGAYHFSAWEADTGDHLNLGVQDLAIQRDLVSKQNKANQTSDWEAKQK